MATIVIISSEHDKSTEVNSIFESYGSIGNSAISLPSLVSSPSSSKAPKIYSYSIAAIKVWIGGLSMNSKLIKSLIPMAFSNNTVIAKFVLCISGTLTGSISFKNASSVYNL